MKRKTKASPMQMSLRYLRANGRDWTCGIVEHWNPHVRIRQDLFSWMDILAYKPTGDTMGVQTTTASNASARLVKLKSLPAVRDWVHNDPGHACRYALLLVWSKTGPRGKRKVWTCREVWL